MGKTNVERQREFKARMYAAGYKQVQVWTPRESEEEASRMDKNKFLKRLDELTAGLSKRRQEGLYAELIKYLETRREGSAQEKG